MKPIAELRKAHSEKQKARLLRQRADLIQLFQKIDHQGNSLNLEREADSFVLESAFSTMHDLPRARHSSSKQAATELDKLRQFATALLRHIDGMHRPALAAFEQLRIGVHPLDLTYDLRRIIPVATIAKNSLASQPPRNARGAPVNSRAQERTDLAAYTFRRITGRQPKGKEFLNFLTCVFDIVGEQAAPAGQVKALEKRRIK